MFYTVLFVNLFFFFFFNDTATTEIYTLSLHDALPICARRNRVGRSRENEAVGYGEARASERSEEHTSELQSQSNLVCRLLLEKKKKKEKRRKTSLRQEIKPSTSVVTWITRIVHTAVQA